MIRIFSTKAKYKHPVRISSMTLSLPAGVHMTKFWNAELDKVGKGILYLTNVGIIFEKTGQGAKFECDFEHLASFEAVKKDRLLVVIRTSEGLKSVEFKTDYKTVTANQIEFEIAEENKVYANSDFYQTSDTSVENKMNDPIASSSSKTPEELRKEGEELLRKNQEKMDRIKNDPALHAKLVKEHYEKMEQSDSAKQRWWAVILQKHNIDPIFGYYKLTQDEEIECLSLFPDDKITKFLPDGIFTPEQMMQKENGAKSGDMIPSRMLSNEKVPRRKVPLGYPWISGTENEDPLVSQFTGERLEFLTMDGFTANDATEINEKTGKPWRWTDYYPKMDASGFDFYRSLAAIEKSHWPKLEKYLTKEAQLKRRKTDLYPYFPGLDFFFNLIVRNGTKLDWIVDLDGYLKTRYPSIDQEQLEYVKNALPKLDAICKELGANIGYPISRLENVVQIAITKGIPVKEMFKWAIDTDGQELSRKLAEKSTSAQLA